MKFTKTLLAVAMAAASTGAMAAPVAWTGDFLMFNPAAGQLDANDGAPGNTAAVTGFIDTAAGTFSLASTDTFFGVNWSTSGGTLFGPGTYTVSTADPLPGVSGGSYTFTVGAGQLGGQIDFAWGSTTGIDVLMVWNVATVGSNIVYTSIDTTADAETLIPGTQMIDGPFQGFSANFNMAAPVPEASTYGMMLAGLGLVGFAVRRRKLVA